MSAATFGDLARAAGGHLEAAARLPQAGLATETVAAAIAQGCRLAGALARYVDDMIGDDAIDLVLSEDAATSIRAAAQAREALRTAAAGLRSAGGVVEPAGPSPGPLIARLAEAAGCLAAGRDLLATHVAAGDDGTRAPISRWSAGSSGFSLGSAPRRAGPGGARQAGTGPDTAWTTSLASASLL